jgi:glycosyltransferase involved in cell wall biosynthesis
MVIPYFYPAWAYGGSPRLAYSLSRSMVQRGHEVTVYTTDAFDNNSRLRIASNPSNIDGIETYYFRNISTGLAWNQKLFVSPSLIAQARKHLRTFDVVHMFDYRTFQNAVVHHYTKKYCIPYVLLAAGSVLPLPRKQNLKRLFDTFFGYKMLRDAAKVIAGSKREIDEYEKMGVNKDRIALVPPSCDIDSFSHLPNPGQFKDKFGIKERNMVLFLGRIDENKGISFLVESFGALGRERDDIILVIAGPDDGYRSVLERLIKRLDLSSRVLFTGFLDGEDKVSALSDATMLIQTSLLERGPGSPFEAILCNTPIVVTKDTGCGDIVAQIDAGYLVEYGNSNELVDTMRKIIDDPTEAREKTRRAREYILANLSWQKAAANYEKLYESIIEARRAK